MNKDAILKTTMYLITTTLIGVVSQLDELKFDFTNMHTNTWVGIFIKSALPGLMTVKALFDVPSKSTTKQKRNV